VINELSIIIPTLNEEHYLPNLLTSIANQTYAGKLQVIVVDGNSSDRTCEVAQSFSDRIQVLSVLTSEADIGRQRNVGAKQAKYRYLLFVDADVVLPLRVLEQLSRRVREGGPFVCGLMHTARDMDLADRAFMSFAYLFVFLSWVAKSPATIGDFILTTRENHRKINGFFEGALLGEDIDYGLRSLKAGAKNLFYFSPQVVASDRRVRQLGRFQLLRLWSKGYRHVLKHGPILPGQGFEYPFGHYGSRSSNSTSSKP
jgi:glycosyltransferase involved in cell wall biosynthesis